FPSHSPNKECLCRADTQLIPSSPPLPHPPPAVIHPNHPPIRTPFQVPIPKAFTPRIQPRSSPPPGWTTQIATASFSPMTTKRSKYDPLATSRLSRWLVLRDMFHNVLDSTELP